MAHRMRHFLALLPLALSALAQSPIVVDNLASAPQSQWTYCAMPVEDLPKANGWLKDTETGQRHAFAVAAEGIHIQLADVPPGLKHKLVFVTDADTEPKFQFSLHPSIDLLAMQPRWFLAGRLSEWPQYWARGEQRPRDSYATVLEQDAYHQVWHVHEITVSPPMTHDLWATIYTGQATVEWETQTSYGTVENNGQIPEIELSPLYMIDRTPKWRDFSAHAGLPQPTSVNADGTIPMLLAPNGTRLHRGRRIQSWGCWHPTEERKVAPLCAVYTGWDGHWFWQGATPQIPLEVDAEHKQALSLFLNPPRVDFWGKPMTYWSARPFAQPPKSDTTGNQYGFGSSDLGPIVSAMQAWRIHYWKWSIDAYALRPTAFRERNGDPMRAVDHPTAATYDGGYDGRFGDDRLGYPAPGTPVTVTTMTDADYGKSDAQHRISRSLHGLARLTGSRALRAIVRDQLEIAKLDQRLKLGWDDAARAIGRVLCEEAGALWLGFDDALPLIQRRMEIAAGSIAQRQGAEVFLLGPIDLAKYGWNYLGTNTPIMGYQYWQQTIAGVQGMDQVWLSTHDQRAHEWAMQAARQVVRYGFHDAGRWLHVYAVNWNNGKQLTDAQWINALWGNPNDYAVVDGACDVWDLASCELIAHDEPDTELGRRATSILAQFGQPRSWMDSNWRAVR